MGAFSSGGGGGSVTVSVQDIAPTNNQTTTSTTPVDIENCVLSTPERENGFAQLSLWCSLQHTGGNNALSIGFEYDGADQEEGGLTTQNASDTLTITATAELDGTDIQGRWYTNADTAKLKNEAGADSRMILFEVG